MATPRETLKYYFRKYALPTEQQFAELIDAFVHKDEDILTQEKIDGLITELAGKVSKETFESFKTEIQGAITSSGSDFTALTDRMTTAEGNITSLREDVDTNTDNISGLNQRVDALEERPQITVDSTLDSESTNPVENKAVTEALGGKADSADVTALSERVSTLENAEPPQVTGSYLKQIADLDSYEGSEGEIVQYIGATNENYRRGFCYEKKAGESGSIEILRLSSKVNNKLSGYTDDDVLQKTSKTVSINRNGTQIIIAPVQVGSSCCYTNAYQIGTVSAIQNGYALCGKDSLLISPDGYETRSIYIDSTGKKYIEKLPVESKSMQLYALSDDEDNPEIIGVMTAKTQYDTMVGSVTSWQVIPTSPCVN